MTAAGPSVAPWRTFVAVPIGGELRAALTRCVADWRLRPQAAGLRWTDPDGWHITLAFLGDVEPGRLPAIAEGLVRAGRRLVPFSLETGSVGGFPSPRRARVAWYGIHDPERRLAQLASAVREALGLDDDRFRPHLTLGRSRDDEGIDLGGWLRPEEAPAATLHVDHLELLRSHRGRGPARYELLVSVSLGATVHV